MKLTRNQKLTRIVAKYWSQASCHSCSWHAAMYEHGYATIEFQANYIHLSCVSEDYRDERHNHRGCYIVPSKKDWRKVLAIADGDDSIYFEY